MNDDRAEKITLIATTIAINLIKDKSPEEIIEIKIILSQILSTINSLCGFNIGKRR